MDILISPKVNARRELQSASGEDLSALMPINRPRIRPRINEWGAVYSFTLAPAHSAGVRLKIRGWYSGEAQVHVLREVQSAGGEHLAKG